jgi:hypothetical protein
MVRWYIQRGGTGTSRLGFCHLSIRLLGYEPQTEFEDGLKNVHGWFAENWEDIRGSGEF